MAPDIPETKRGLPEKLSSFSCTVFGGFGILTATSVLCAITNVARSMAKMTHRRSKPSTPMRALAKMGAATPEALSAMEIMPLARWYCTFGTIMLMAALYAGHWKL